MSAEESKVGEKGALSLVMTGDERSESLAAECASSRAANSAAALFTSANEIGGFEEAGRDCSNAAKAAMPRSIAALCARTCCSASETCSIFSRSAKVAAALLTSAVETGGF